MRAFTSAVCLALGAIFNAQEVAAAAYSALDAAECASMLADTQNSAGRRSPTPDDLVRLRDIGQPESSLLRGESPLSLSPDAMRVAFVITQASPSTNSYCVGLIVLEIDESAPPKLVDYGGELIRIPPDEIRGILSPNGFPAIVRPQWSPDGLRIAYLKRISGVTQVQLVDLAGGSSNLFVHPDADIESVTWSVDGRSLIYRARPGLADALLERDREGLGGFLYDERFVPDATGAPRLRAPIPYEYFAIDVTSSVHRPATSEEEARLEIAASRAQRPGARLYAASDSGNREAWTAPRDTSIYSQVELWISSDGKDLRCTFDACNSEIIGLWWSPNGDKLLFLRTFGWGDSQLALFEMSGPHEAPRRLFVTDDVLVGCQLANTQLVCARDSSLRPRRIVAIDPATSESRTLFNPNPVWDDLALATVERLHWRTKAGYEAFGDLVLPPDYDHRGRLPLIVVQYLTKGFLRGGTGDEVPIQAFAARGYAVLSVHQLPRYARTVASPNWRTIAEAERLNVRRWRDRRNRVSALSEMVDLLIDRGIVDPDKIGITGFSDGSTTAQFALVNTRHFSAASISACCMEPTSTMIYGGPGWTQQLQSFGYPVLGESFEKFWKPISISLNAQTIDAPVLMQLDDEGYLLGLETFAALRAQSKAAELYIFPGEYHYKWQPAHRLAIYNRNLDWFDYWLLDRKDTSEDKVAQYIRWDALRAEAELARRRR